MGKEYFVDIYPSYCREDHPEQIPLSWTFDRLCEAYELIEYAVNAGYAPFIYTVESQEP